MIPRKVSWLRARKAKNYAASLPKPEGDMVYLAENNTRRRFSDKKVVEERLGSALKFRRHKRFDSTKGWHVSFHSDLRRTSIALGTDLVDFIKKHASKGKVLEIGCGDGTTISQLQRKVPGTRLSLIHI